jgi:hypothetical protein
MRAVPLSLLWFLSPRRRKGGPWQRQTALSAWFYRFRGVLGTTELSQTASMLGVGHGEWPVSTRARKVGRGYNLSFNKYPIAMSLGHNRTQFCVEKFSARMHFVPYSIGGIANSMKIKSLINKFLPYLDIFLAILVFPTSMYLKAIRKLGVHRLPFCKRVLFEVGIFPIRNHYYEPQFDMRNMDKESSEERNLPGINWNQIEQLETLKTLRFSDELKKFPLQPSDKLRFYFNNGSFASGDAEFWYQLIRQRKPKNIFEVGSGNSTLMAREAIRRNHDEDPSYQCNHVCIEPYEMPWLEQLKINVIREKVEDLDISFFSELKKDDILFIDSSHMIRPQGDVLFEYLELIPMLNVGVIVHFHDIFSPRNYPKDWLINEVRFWNEQYLLEAFLSHNRSWKILAALNYLHHNHYESLKSIAPFLTPDCEPGSFYIQRII